MRARFSPDPALAVSLQLFVEDCCLRRSRGSRFTGQLVFAGGLLSRPEKNTTGVRGLVRAPPRLPGLSRCGARGGLAAHRGAVRIDV